MIFSIEAFNFVYIPTFCIVDGYLTFLKACSCTPLGSALVCLPYIRGIVLFDFFLPSFVRINLDISIDYGNISFKFSELSTDWQFQIQVIKNFKVVL